MMQHLNRNACCGHTFTAQDIRGRIMTQKQAFGREIPHLYGGNAKYFAETICPTCKRKYLLWMRPAKPYDVLTISDLGEGEAKEAVQEKQGLDIPDFDHMDANALRAWLRERGVSFFYGHPVEKLRELARAVAFDPA